MSSEENSGGSRITRVLIVALALAILVGVTASSQASHLFSDTAGHTTTEQVVTGSNPQNGFSNLHTESVNTSYVVRDGAREGDSRFPNAPAGRDQRRRSLAYFGQLTDFQLADEESPARVEFTDESSNSDPSHTAESAWRPQEALQPFIIDWSIRQMNLFAPASPVPQGDGTRAPMDFALMTGDQADNQERNEIIWTRQLLEGTQNQLTNFNSGSTNPNDYDPTAHPSCTAFQAPGQLAKGIAEAPKYTGVQDYKDYVERSPYFYDPNDVRGFWATMGFPTYPGLMDRAQVNDFAPAGSAVPTYVTNGNHDSLVQGNAAANKAYEDIATGCQKMLASAQQPTPIVDPDGPDPSVLLGPATASMLVPPDPLRRLVNRAQIRQLYEANGIDNGHGYDFVDINELKASCPLELQPCDDATAKREGAASYYAWDPPEAPGFRFISIDTVSEGGVIGPSSSGNIDDPQFQWLTHELDVASAQDKLIVLWGHHPIRSLTADVADEQAGACNPPRRTWGDTPEHYQNAGCDLDPRSSEPLHFGVDSQAGDPRVSLVDLLSQHPHVIAYVPGHTHENRILPCGMTSGVCAPGGVWWEINTAATADWPVEHRLIEVMDNKDGTLSIFGTLLDHAAASQAPPSGTSAQNFNSATLASIGRVLAYNDPQKGSRPPDYPTRTGECGDVSNPSDCMADQDVELLVPDPRFRHPHPQSASPVRTSLVPVFRQCGTPGNTPNSSHGGPFPLQSCNPPVPVGIARVGNQSVGSSEIAAMPGNLSTGANEADVAFSLSASDIRDGSPTGPDYAPNPSGPDMRLTARWRLTDLRNGSAQDDSATATEFDFAVPVNCATTADSSVGSTCAVNTSANAVTPGAIQEGGSAVVQVFRVRLVDAGADHNQGNSDDRLFEQQGLFVPGGPAPSYEVPASAPLIDNALVPNFRQCGTAGNTPNTTHAPSLSVQSCRPPVPTSSVAKVGPQSVASAQETVIPGDNDSSNGDQADISLALNATDIQSSAGGDYTPNASGPDATLITRLRLTDLFNGAGSTKTNPGTTQEFDFWIPVNCTATSDPALGATCNTNTTVDALAPGGVREDKQAILQVFRLRLQDSGPDGTRLSPDDTLLEMQGLYVP